jgi:hypothetical protein
MAHYVADAEHRRFITKGEFKQEKPWRATTFTTILASEYRMEIVVANNAIYVQTFDLPSDRAKRDSNSVLRVTDSKCINLAKRIVKRYEYNTNNEGRGDDRAYENAVAALMRITDAKLVDFWANEKNNKERISDTVVDAQLY